MKKAIFGSDTLLLLTAAIWGFAFTAQRAGMDYIGPFLYTGIRFLLGAMVLVPFWVCRSPKYRKQKPARDKLPDASTIVLVRSGAIAGVFLLLGVSFQQVGLLYTTAGKAGFITGLYVIIVPLLGIIWKQRSRTGTWIGALFAVAGLYFLSVTGGFHIGAGDLLMLASAFFWALHVHVIGRFSKEVDSVKLAVVQYVFCGAVSLIIGFAAETVSLAAVIDAALPISYGGICSVGIAYTLQIVAQKSAPPAHAAIIMSLEGVFAVVGGYLILGETLSPRGFAGCALMLCGMIISQVTVTRRVNRALSS
jgi:drug/metabolite transporter (DMT)-like permease